MTNQKHDESMMKLDKCHKVVLQNSAKGISAVEVARKLGIHRTTAYNYLNSLELMGKVENTHGIWRAKTEEQTIRPLEKEIVIELPIPKNQWQRIAAMEMLAKDWEASVPKMQNNYRVFLETFRETRTIRVKGKNVDDLDLEKLGNLIQQAYEKSSKTNLKSLFKSLRR